ERLGWLNYGASPSIQTIQTSGTYTIYPYETGGAGPNAFKVLKSTDPATGAKTWYYLEARQAVGFDAFLTNSTYYTQNETTGVLFHIGTDGNGNTSDLLDMTPATPTSTGWFDPSLVAGQSFQDSTAAVNTTALSLSPGKSGSATLTGTSPMGTPDGSYNLGVSATNASASSYNGSATATYVISTAPLTTSVTTNQSSYLPGQTVAVTVTML